MKRAAVSTIVCLLACAAGAAQSPREPDWTAVRDRDHAPLPGAAAPRHQQPARQRAAGPPSISSRCWRRRVSRRRSSRSSRQRSNVVARLKGNGSKRPLLIMGHTDVVTVDAAKWTHPPSARPATADTSTAAARSTTRTTSRPRLMTMLLLKRLKVPLDRDVIFLAESGEEGNTQRRHRVHGEPALSRDRRRVLPRRGRRRHPDRTARSKFATVQTLEKSAARDRAGRTRRGRARVGAAEVQRHRAPRRRRWRRSAAGGRRSG